MDNSNLQIIQRLLELGKNPYGTYELFPQGFKTEYMFLSNVLSDGLARMEWEFTEKFKTAVNSYKQSKKASGKKYGWFHSPENLVWCNTYINQIKYAIYGDSFIHEIKFNPELKEKAYLDLINQIDRTALMTPYQLKKHNAECNRMSLEILEELTAEINAKLDKKI